MGVQGRVKQAIKTLKHPHLWRSPKRPLTQYWKLFFDSQLLGLLNP